MKQKAYLNSAYALETMDQTMDLYRDWAETYDDEISANGYASPLRTAQALICCGAKPGLPVLDIGCGSGVSGEFLRQHGFTDMHGCDFSEAMLALAEQKQIYTKLHRSEPQNPFDFVSVPYETAAAIGVMAPGHAGPDLISTAIQLLTVGGLFGFSMNDHTLENRGYMDEIDRLVKNKEIRIRWSEYGDHLPGINLQSLIVVLERLC